MTVTAKTVCKAMLSDCEVISVTFTTDEFPAGRTLKAIADIPLVLPNDTTGGCGPWWSLTGAVTHAAKHRSRWVWDGKGDCKDWRGNPVLSLIALVE